MSNRPSRAQLEEFGPFEIIERLGHGGMGTVYKATHPNYSEPIALKIAHEGVAAEITLSRRFHNEYLIGRQLSHSHLVKVLEYGVVDDLPYLVMEYLPGGNLHEHIERLGALTVEQAVPLFEQIANALDFVHHKKLIHRDIKPENLLIDLGGNLKLADLGLIKDQDSGAALTVSRAALGTPDYGAPEQFEDAGKADHRSDIFALGVTLYFALTGTFPFGRGSQATVLRRKLMFEFTPLSLLLPKVTRGLDQIVIRSLHPDPNERPSSAAEFMRGVRDQLPAGQPDVTPKFPARNLPGARERRYLRRFDLSVEGVQISLSPTERQFDAAIVNISTGGICLRLLRAFSSGTDFTIALPLRGSSRPFRIRVSWLRQTPDNAWLHGCVFTSPIKEDELQELMNSALPKTEPNLFPAKQ